tara:strand:- start:218 stop:1078 length:861 start_codon:yes stop_codon:yes gene_type:complete
LGKTAENIAYYLDSKNDKDYLQDLLLNIKEAYVKQEKLTFKIVEPKERGFTVKVGGLFAFVSFNHLSWSYPSIEFWRNVSKYLVGNFFTGRIYKVGENPISIQIDAKEQAFEKPNLEHYAEYRGVILQKTRYGFFVDLGVHFNWKYGSLLGLVHRSTLKNESDYDRWNAGSEVTTHFQGFNENGDFVLGDDCERGKWLNGEMDKLIGTIQSVSVLIKKNRQTEFYVQGKHKARIPISNVFYPSFKNRVKKYIYGLENGQIIDCEVIKIDKRKDCFILRLQIDPATK